MIVLRSKMSGAACLYMSGIQEGRQVLMRKCSRAEFAYFLVMLALNARNSKRTPKRHNCGVAACEGSDEDAVET